MLILPVAKPLREGKQSCFETNLQLINIFHHLPSNAMAFCQTYHLTDRQTDRQTDRPSDRQTEQPTDRRTNQQTDRPTNRQTDQPTYRRTNQQTDRPTDRQTNRQTERLTNRQTHRLQALISRLVFPHCWIVSHFEDSIIYIQTVQDLGTSPKLLCEKTYIVPGVQNVHWSHFPLLMSIFI